MDVSRRDQLLCSALLECENKVDNVIMANKCIPVSRGLLKPEELIDPSSPLRDLYDENDGPFPKWLLGNMSKVMKSRIRSALENLGMRKDYLTENEIIECSQTIRKLTFHKGRQRTKCLLVYLERNSDQVQSLATNLQKISFLPIAEKPNMWFVDWYSDSCKRNFVSIDEAFPVEQKMLVGSSKIIASFPNDSKSLQEKLGFGSKQIVFEDVHAQFREARKAIFNLKPWERNRNEKSFLKSMMKSIYNYLNKLAKSNPNVVREYYSNEKVLMVECKKNDLTLVSPKICAKQDFDGHPYLYSVPLNLRRYFHFLEALGVKENFETKMFIQSLQTIAKKESEIKAYSYTLKVVRNISTDLCKLLDQEHKREQSCLSVKWGPIYLPDTSGRMTQVSNLCYNNYPWHTDPRKKFLHPTIPFEEAELLGVKTLREKLLTKCQTGIPFGQHEKLTKRIKRLLDSYPCDKGILKELLQNADDAGATEIHFILDNRQHKTEKLFSEDWAPIQGPALLVYNDKPFTKADLEGIQNLGEGSKASDPLTTGKYGVGFNCVYHITDTPTFLTADPDTNDHHLIALDPQCKYVAGSTREFPGQMFDNMRTTQKDFPDVYECFNLPIETRNGTIFRLPLRTRKMSMDSEISQNVITGDYIQTLLIEFSESMEENLLFLGNVRKISLSEIRDERGNLYTMHKVQANLTDKGKETKRSFISSVEDAARAMKIGSLKDVSFTQCNYELNIESYGNNVSRSKWLIVQQIGFRDNAIFSDTDIVDDDVVRNITMLPRGGVAYCISCDKKTERKHSKTTGKPTVRISKNEHKLFCFLPLPMKIDFPMHVNGNFALDHESRRNLWSDENNIGYKSKWNKLIFSQVVADCYNTAVECVRCTVPTQGTYSYVTRKLKEFSVLLKINGSGFYLKILETSVYKDMISKNARFLPVVQRRSIWKEHDKIPASTQVDVVWYPVSTTGHASVYFDTLSKQLPEESDQRVLTTPPKLPKTEEYVRNVLCNCNFPLVYPKGNFLLNKLKGVNTDITADEVSPKAVLQFLIPKAEYFKFPKRLENTEFVDRKALSALLLYCINDLSEFLEGMPILLSADGTMRVFSLESPLLASAYYDLFPRHISEFADWSFFQEIKNVQNIKQFVKKMTCKDLVRFLPSVLEVTQFLGEEKTVQLNFQEDGALKNWLLRLWKFIDTDCWEIQYTDTLFLPNKVFLEENLHILNDWCLMPVQCNNLELWPIGRCKEVINISKDYGLEEVLQTISMPRIPLTDSVDLVRTFEHISTDLEKPASVLFAIGKALERQLIHFDGLDYDHGCCDILRYFDDNVEKIQQLNNAIHILKCMPVYMKMDGSIGDLMQTNCGMYTVPTSIPEASNLSESSNKIYMYKKQEFEKLYTFIGVCPLKVEEAYINHILPYIHLFTDEERTEHLVFLKIHIQGNEMQSQSKTVEERNKIFRLITKLKSVPLLIGQNGTLEKVSSFYDPHVKLFNGKQFPKRTILSERMD